MRSVMLCRLSLRSLKGSGRSEEFVSELHQVARSFSLAFAQSLLDSTHQLSLFSLDLLSSKKRQC